MDHRCRMDRIYRFQRHFYDATRPLFLPGRDALLRAAEAAPGDLILEMGCGTARNLIHLARRFDKVRLFGIDASKEMLATAERAVRRAGLADRIFLACEVAENVRSEAPFSTEGGFDTIFFSYSLSMMPDWKAALDAAQAALRPGGDLLAADFMDLHGWPGPTRAAINRWLSLFHVRFDPRMHDALRARFAHIELRPLYGGYAFLAIHRGTVAKMARSDGRSILQHDA